MNTRISQTKISITLLSVLLMAFTTNTWAGGHKQHSSIAWAKVTNVEPIIRSVETRVPRHECWEEQVSYDQFYDPGRSHTGTIVGGIIGGALGNAVGHRKKNKRIGTAVGALLGASVGSDIAARHQHHHSRGKHYRNQQRCNVSHQTRYDDEVVGYRVWYRYKGDNYKTRMSHKPGKRIKVRVNVSPI